MNKIVECVPNFSEGKDLAKIERIVAPLKNKENVKLVGVEPDASYNRTVVTVIGEPQAVKNAVVECVIIASQEIDLNHHMGEHKRMGATDVVPFIPITNISIEETVELSKECAKEINEKANIPVFLYSNSATNPDRVKLPTIRKGEFEGMAEKLKDPHWAPDYGEAKIHPTAGVTAVGCRPFLIAFNIDCATKDKEAIKFIAKAIRLSGGGYKCIQAGPAEMEDFIQVTMNVTDSAKRIKLDVGEVIQQVAALYRPALERNGVTLNTDIDTELAVYGNPEELTQVLFNILQNSKEHTQSGCITISAVRENGTITITVTDTGSGLPPEILPRAFERGVTGKDGGTGIGLAICKDIMDAHSGTIRIANGDCGAVVTLTLREYREDASHAAEG